jgi:VWFA-related protein
VWTAAAVSLCAGVIAAQAPPPQQAPPDPQRPTFRTEANFVRVDAYPTSDGKPVLDLTREDFEVLEDGRQQSIDSFEHIRIGAAGPQPRREDPNSLEAMRQAAADPRSRVFVIFLDVNHVTTDGAKNIGGALIKFINRTLGPDDLVGIVTPWMAPSDVVFGRRTEVIERALREGTWGRRFTTDGDAREAKYEACYRVLKQELEQGKSVSDLARALIVRRRELTTLEALRDLVVYLRGVREERKAILTITEGWALYRPDSRITRLREECTCEGGFPRPELAECGSNCKPWPPGGQWKEPVPGREPIGTGPDGRLRIGSVDTLSGNVSMNECNADRMQLANIDNARLARDVVNDANRGNSTFYTIDPRGLAVFDMPIYRDMDEVGLPVNVVADASSLRARHAAMADLATGTDGIALMNSNDLDAGLRRITEDLSSYYLIGYYSTNARLDGRFRSISVRVKRPGVHVRARRGYRAPTEEEVAAARVSAAPPAPEPLSGVAAALTTLARARSDGRFRIHAIPVRTPSGATVVWVAGELPSAQEWSAGGTTTLELSGPGVSGNATLTLKAGERAFLTSIPVQGSGATLDVRARLTNPDPAITPFRELIRVDLSSGAPQALLFRRGPATGNRLQPVADFQLRRTDRLRVEVPAGRDVKPVSGRLLDRAGKALEIPVAAGERTDDTTGQRWLTADVALAALAAGDYVVELTAAAAASEQRILTPFRVTR